MLAVYGSEIVASAGLLMDIFGIWLLFRHGAIGGDWIKVPGPPPSLRDGRSSEWPVLELAAESETEHNRRRAMWGSLIGLALATLGFILQIVAQWL